jgi:hypothetical protein
MKILNNLMDKQCFLRLPREAKIWQIVEILEDINDIPETKFYGKYTHRIYDESYYNYKKTLDNYYGIDEIDELYDQIIVINGYNQKILLADIELLFAIRVITDINDIKRIKFILYETVPINDKAMVEWLIIPKKLRFIEINEDLRSDRLSLDISRLDHITTDKELMNEKGIENLLESRMHYWDIDFGYILVNAEAYRTFELYRYNDIYSIRYENKYSSDICYRVQFTMKLIRNINLMAQYHIKLTKNMYDKDSMQKLESLHKFMKDTQLLMEEIDNFSEKKSKQRQQDVLNYQWYTDKYVDNVIINSEENIDAIIRRTRASLTIHYKIIVDKYLDKVKNLFILYKQYEL